MAEAFQYDVFLSHSEKDKAVVRTVEERLRKDWLVLKAQGRGHLDRRCNDCQGC